MLRIFPLFKKSKPKIEETPTITISYPITFSANEFPEFATTISDAFGEKITRDENDSRIPFASHIDKMIITSGNESDDYVIHTTLLSAYIAAYAGAFGTTPSKDTLLAARDMFALKVYRPQAF